ncbi:hypothetical protein EST38_g383 [Candolleomyces aberdarensis]|uniref:NADAR domain-containing protein n=1 Tax=Candolleomyces aberdarensis TaxID=2316362 RepID=A0A4Q2DYQ2_9AGAR|nr:hypothetical protein EST38_g383 [Candolleomyces aberdarensis]
MEQTQFNQGQNTSPLLQAAANTNASGPFDLNRYQTPLPDSPPQVWNTLAELPLEQPSQIKRDQEAQSSGLISTEAAFMVEGSAGSEPGAAGHEQPMPEQISVTHDDVSGPTSLEDQSLTFNSRQLWSPFRALSMDTVPVAHGGLQYFSALHLFKEHLAENPIVAPEFKARDGAHDIHGPLSCHHGTGHKDLCQDFLIMLEEALVLSFEQDEPLKQVLLSTGGRPLKYSDPSDAFWGIREDGTGCNEYGRCLMRVRQKLQEISCFA